MSDVDVLYSGDLPGALMLVGSMFGNLFGSFLDTFANPFSSGADPVVEEPAPAAAPADDAASVEPGFADPADLFSSSSVDPNALGAGLSDIAGAASGAAGAVSDSTGAVFSALSSFDPSDFIVVLVVMWFALVVLSHSALWKRIAGVEWPTIVSVVIGAVIIAVLVPFCVSGVMSLDPRLLAGFPLLVFLVFVGLPFFAILIWLFEVISLMITHPGAPLLGGKKKESRDKREGAPSREGRGDPSDADSIGDRAFDPDAPAPAELDASAVVLDDAVGASDPGDQDSSRSTSQDVIDDLAVDFEVIEDDDPALAGSPSEEMSSSFSPEGAFDAESHGSPGRPSPSDAACAASFGSSGDVAALPSADGLFGDPDASASIREVDALFGLDGERR